MGKTPSTTKAKPTAPKQQDLRTEFVCCMCGKKYNRQSGNFPYMQSKLYNGNNHYLHICTDCVNELYQTYVAETGSEGKAMEKLCYRFDMYWSLALFESTEKISASVPRPIAYIRNTNLRPFFQKTYDDTLNEMIITGDNDSPTEEGEEVSEELKKFWGYGYTPEEYINLQYQYDDWITRCECNGKAQEEIFKNLCLAQRNISVAQRTGGKALIDAQRSFQDLLGTANLKPVQNSKDSVAENNTFGTLIKKWEDEDPIPEPDPEWKDVDGIVRYITVYFLGHLCKMMGIKNSYSAAYEKEMAKYTVERPEYEGDDEAVFDAVFGGNRTDT